MATDESTPPSDEVPDDDPMAGPVGAGLDFTDPNSPLAPYYMTATGVLATGLLAALMLLYSYLPLNPTDVWAHVKLGGWIVENRQLPLHEPFSPYTVKEDSEVTFQPWLAQVTYFGAFRLGQRLTSRNPAGQFHGGAEVLRILHIGPIVAFYGLMWLAFRRMSGSGSLARLGLIFQFFMVLSAVGVQRPQLFSLVLFAAFLFILSRPLLTRRAVVLIPILATIWANTHGGFVVGFGLLGVVWLGRAIECGSLRAAFADTHLRRLTLAGAIAALAVAFLNPMGPKIYLLAANFGNNPNLKTLQEWMPVDFINPGNGSRLYAATLVATLLTLALSPLRITPTHAIISLVFGIVPLVQQRMMTWWCPLVLWQLMPHWAAIAERWGLVWPPSTPSLRKTVLAVLLLFPFVMLTPPVGWLQTGQLPPPAITFRAGTPLDLLNVLAAPTAPQAVRMQTLAASLQKRYPNRTVGPLLVSESLGELFYAVELPDSPPLLITHAHLFPPTHWLGALNASIGSPGWWEFADRHRVNLIAVEPDSHEKLVQQVKEQADTWEVVLDETESELIRDPRARLFVALRKQPLPLPEGRR